MNGKYRHECVNRSMDALHPVPLPRLVSTPTSTLTCTGLKLVVYTDPRLTEGSQRGWSQERPKHALI